MINISGLIKGNTYRQSNMELLRMVAILAIVFYHILLFVHNNLSDAPIYQALFLPLHVGVLLFVMISGYFRIKFSIKKLIILIVPLFILCHLLLIHCFVENIVFMIKLILFFLSLIVNTGL